MRVVALRVGEENPARRRMPGLDRFDEMEDSARSLCLSPSARRTNRGIVRPGIDKGPRGERRRIPDPILLTGGRYLAAWIDRERPRIEERKDPASRIAS
jgi:hypothetical protein